MASAAAAEDALEAIGIGDFVAPTEADGAVSVYFSPHDSDRFVSAVDVLDGKVDRAQIEQKLVLIGATAVGQGATDIGATPFSIYLTSSPEQVAYVLQDAAPRVAIVEEHLIGVPASSMMVLMLILHVFRVYLTGGFKRPRELTWVVSCFS